MDEYKGPPRIDVEKLDFSEFHPLDHNLWQCRGYPGGRKTHLLYSYDFKWSYALRAKTTCKLGWHYKTGQAHARPFEWPPTPAAEADNWVTWKICSFCFKRLSEPQPE